MRVAWLYTFRGYSLNETCHAISQNILINNNKSGNIDGFVAYSFKDPSGNAYFSFRGSESNTPEVQNDGMLGRSIN